MGRGCGDFAGTLGQFVVRELSETGCPKCRSHLLALRVRSLSRARLCNVCKACETPDPLAPGCVLVWDTRQRGQARSASEWVHIIIPKRRLWAKWTLNRNTQNRTRPVVMPEPTRQPETTIYHGVRAMLSAYHNPPAP